MGEYKWNKTENLQDKCARLNKKEKAFIENGIPSEAAREIFHRKPYYLRKERDAHDI